MCEPNYEAKAELVKPLELILTVLWRVPPLWTGLPTYCFSVTP